MGLSPISILVSHLLLICTRVTEGSIGSWQKQPVRDCSGPAVCSQRTLLLLTKQVVCLTKLTTACLPIRSFSQRGPMYGSGQMQLKLESLLPGMHVPSFWQGFCRHGEPARREGDVSGSQGNPAWGSFPLLPCMRKGSRTVLVHVLRGFLGSGPGA